MHGHTGGGHVGGGGHMPPVHHQPHPTHHHEVHNADWTSSDRPHIGALATRIRSPKMAAATAIGVVLALLILLLVFI
jgi:hypothetical protein